MPLSEREILLREALLDAIDGMEDMISYVPEYFQTKWEHQAYITRAKATLTQTTGVTSDAG